MAVFEMQTKLINFPKSVMLNEIVSIIRKVKEWKTRCLLLISHF